MNKRQIKYLVAQFNVDEALLYLRDECGMSDEDAERTVARMAGWLKLAIDEPPQRDSVAMAPLEREVVRQELQRMVSAGDGSPQMLAAAQRVLGQIGKRPAHLARLPVSDSDRRILDRGLSPERGLESETRSTTHDPRPAKVERRVDSHEWVVVGVDRGDGFVVKPIHDMGISKAGAEHLLTVDGSPTAPLWRTLNAARIEASRRDAAGRADTATVHSDPDQWTLRLRAYIRGAFASRFDQSHVAGVEYLTEEETWSVIVRDRSAKSSAVVWTMRVTSDDDEFCFHSGLGARVTFPIPEEL